jgi:hypothetical protein
MSLSEIAYQALEAVVGYENISDDPALCDSYAFIFPHSAESFLLQQIAKGDGHFAARPDAVVLPGSTEEVQGVIKTCNRYGVKFRAFSTGWIFFATPLAEGVVILDLRRMNRILEIDAKNMYAVVQPYVIAAQLQAETMKIGLNCNIIGAGAGCSPLAQSTSFSGHGPSSLYTGHASEVMLAVEWVLPNGEIVKTGSMGGGSGWFCAEGPGPGLRGIVRGNIGAFGGVGVFTKCAVKLSAWPGPSELPIKGTIPAYKTAIPENTSVYTIAFHDWQAYADAYYKIWDSEIGYIAHRQFNVFGNDLAYAFLRMYIEPGKNLNDMVELLKLPEIKKVTEEMRISFQIILMGNSRNDFEYQEKVLNQILKETGGWKVAAMSEPAMQEFVYLYLVRLGHKNLNHAYTGGAGHSVTQKVSPDSLAPQVPIQAETLAKYQESGLLVKTGGDTMMGCVGPMGGGTYSIFEQFHFYDPHNVESIKASVEFQHAAKKALSGSGFMVGSVEDVIAALKPTKEEGDALLSNAPEPMIFHFQWLIKQIIDGGNTAAPGYNVLDKLPAK